MLYGFNFVSKFLIKNGILKGSQPFSGFQRQRLWWGVEQRPTIRKALRKG